MKCIATFCILLIVVVICGLGCGTSLGSTELQPGDTIVSVLGRRVLIPMGQEEPYLNMGTNARGKHLRPRPFHRNAIGENRQVVFSQIRLWGVVGGEETTDAYYRDWAPPLWRERPRSCPFRTVTTFTAMSERYKFVEGHVHLITFAVVGWVDVFTRRAYAEFLLHNWAYCRKNKGLRLYEFVIMPNQLHLIAAAANGSLGEIMRDFKTFTSKELVKLIAANPRESRKDWMLRVFREHGAANPLNVHHQFWQQSNKPITLDKPEKFE